MNLLDIREGILNNLAVKNKHTLDVDPVLEGNSYFGQCIFVGVSRMFNFSKEEIQQFLYEPMNFWKKSFYQY